MNKPDKWYFRACAYIRYQTKRHDLTPEDLRAATIKAAELRASAALRRR